MEVEVEAEGLQRSITSFRRSGSSGLVWNDKLLAMQENSEPKKDLQVNPGRSNTTNKEPNTFKTNKDVNSMVDPPSPKVSSCACCAMFAKPKNNKFSKRKS